MARDSDGIDITLAKPKPDSTASKTDALPVEPHGKYAQPSSGGDVELGRGGMGRVLRLEDTHLEREVAIKELLAQHHPSSSSQGPALANLFIKEAQVLARLEHPGIVPIYELGRRPDGTPYYAMRKIRGRQLSVALEACGSLDERLSLLPHLVDVAHTAGFAHAQGIVHRDLKPANVMIGSFGETLVVDWGLAQVSGQRDGEGHIAGTPAYMSPEQVKGERVDARSDVWAMGVMLYELLSGSPPYDAPSVTELLNRVRTHEVPPLLKREPKVPKPLAAVVQKALQRDPSLRYENGEALALALEAGLRARRPRPVTIPILFVAALVGMLVLFFRAQGTSERLGADVAQARLATDDTKRALAKSLAEAAVVALRANDGFRAERLAKDALLHAPNALARGVLLVTAEHGVPRLEWKVPVEAGCARVAVTSTLVACSTLNAVELFDAKTGEAKATLSAGPGAGWLPALAVLSDDSIMAGADSRTLFHWELARPKVPELITFPESITTLAPAAGGVIVGLRDGQLFSQPRHGERTVLPRLSTRVKALAADGATYAAGGEGTMRLATVEGKELASLDRSILALDFGGKHALFAGVERSVLRLEGSTLTQLFSGHRDTVTAVSAGPRLASGDAEGSVRVWFDGGELFTTWTAFEPGVQALSWTNDGRSLIVAPRGRALEAWSIPEPPRTLEDDGVPVFQTFWRRGWLVTGLRDGRIRKVEGATLRADVFESKHRGPVRAIAEVPGPETGAALRHLSGGDDGRVLAQRWNGEVETLDEVAAKVTAIDVSADAARAAWAFEDGTVVLWALGPAKEVRRLREAPVRALQFSGDGRQLALGRDDRRVLLLAAEDGRDLGRLEETDAAILSVRWLGKDVVVGLANGQVQRWSVSDRRATQAFAQPTDRVLGLATSDDAALLAAGSDDGRVYVWNARSGELLAEIPADAGEVKNVAFVGNDALFAAGTDRRVHLWNLDEAALPR